MALTEIKSIADTVHPEAVRLLYWDTQVCQDERYSRTISILWLSQRAQGWRRHIRRVRPRIHDCQTHHATSCRRHYRRLSWRCVGSVVMSCAVGCHRQRRCQAGLWRHSPCQIIQHVITEFRKKGKNQWLCHTSIRPRSTRSPNSTRASSLCVAGTWVKMYALADRKRDHERVKKIHGNCYALMCGGYYDEVYGYYYHAKSGQPTLNECAKLAPIVWHRMPAGTTTVSIRNGIGHGTHTGHYSFLERFLPRGMMFHVHSGKQYVCILGGKRLPASACMCRAGVGSRQASWVAEPWQLDARKRRRISTYIHTW